MFLNGVGMASQRIIFFIFLTSSLAGFFDLMKIRLDSVEDLKDEWAHVAFHILHVED